MFCWALLMISVALVRQPAASQWRRHQNQRAGVAVGLEPTSGQYWARVLLYVRVQYGQSGARARTRLEHQNDSSFCRSSAIVYVVCAPVAPD